MTPIDPSKLANMLPAKRRKRGERRVYVPTTQERLAKVKYGSGNFTLGTGKWRSGKKMECKWCHHNFVPDGRPIFACNRCWSRELTWRIQKGRDIKQAWLEHHDNIEKERMRIE